ncbi:LANO_0B08746g1_1 [Lachancea nothofagi CBS 11611]|uniref:LANO_0B08746g1_1 n=1 Tax=Lachancea nothofagi CBS 11611 TaxID=1266666 RepID=A0A1G4J0Y4_9SACH|nr:LANO_0B08746g1_1 [Lachancea nothofagi CBS 11611]
MTNKSEEKISDSVEILDGVSSTDVNDKVAAVFQEYLPEEHVLSEVDYIAKENNLESYRELLNRGALWANNPKIIETDEYAVSERRAFERSRTHPMLSLSPHMKLAAICTSCAAINFGMDESAIGGAVLQYQTQFNITDANIQGLTVAAPYLAAAIIGAPLTLYLDKYMGRKWIILLSCVIGFAGSLIQGFSNGLGCLLFARLFLGIGMGLNSSTVPIYTAECSPAHSRGAVLMLWQTFIALGVCLGSVFNRAFVGISGSLSWRLMIGSSAVAPFITGILIFFPPESPRWLIVNGRARESLDALIKLRPNDLTGARDFYILHQSLKFEAELKNPLSSWQQFKSLFGNARNRFAIIVSFIGILGQQYGGVNILVSYTTTILTKAGVDPVTAIAGSIGIGGGCFLATFLSTQLIDRYGRRKMLLFTLPVEAICLFWLGGVLNVQNTQSRLGAGLASMYVFVLFYGTGIGPVSFTLVAETSSISVRMAHSATCMFVNWILDFCLSMTWPKMNATMTTSGGLYFYGAFNILIWALAYFCIPETKQFTLEQLDEIFKVGILAHIKKTSRYLTTWKGRHK